MVLEFKEQTNFRLNFWVSKVPSCRGKNVLNTISYLSNHTAAHGVEKAVLLQKTCKKEKLKQLSTTR